MSATARGWVAFAAVAAGLLHVALAVGRPLELAAILFVIGLVEFAWGAIVLSRSAVLAPEVTLPLALAPGILWAVALFAHVPGLPLFPLATTTLLELFIAVMIARSIRRVDEPAAPSPRRHALGLALGLLVIAAVTLPALTFTQAEDPTSQLPPPEHGHR